LNSLQKLKLYFNNCRGFENTCLKPFKDYEKSNQLKAVALYCNDCEITDSGIINLLVYLSQSSEKSPSLTLSVQGCDKVSLEVLGSQIHLKIPEIKELSLELDQKNITAQAIERFTEGIGSVAKNLESLNLNFNDDLFDKKCFEHLCDLLKESTNLKRLALYFSSSNLFGSVCNEITDEGIEILQDSIIKYLQNLEVLVLIFVSCKKLTERSCQMFESPQLQEIKTLKKIYLNFTKKIFFFSDFLLFLVKLTF